MRWLEDAELKVDTEAKGTQQNSICHRRNKVESKPCILQKQLAQKIKHFSKNFCITH